MESQVNDSSCPMQQKDACMAPASHYFPINSYQKKKDAEN